VCGIAGVFQRIPDGCEEAGLVERMTTRLAHRGPDSTGYFQGGPVRFGFRRLAIVDPGSGIQPMANEDGSVVSMCNGELYNFADTARFLADRGHRLKTRCDAEIIPHLYEEHGIRLLDHLHGQFALAIFDRLRRVLYLARDHFGVQPLYYTQVGSTFLFASEIKALLEHPGVSRDVDLTALDQTLCFPGLISPHTIVRSISAVRNGEYLSVSASGVKTIEYWDLDYPRDADAAPARDETFYLDGLEERMLASAARRLQADVPVGVYLSGGLDSSVVAGAVRAVSPDVTRHTFSVSFGGGAMCEAAHQRVAAAAVQSLHHDVPFTVDDVARRLQQAVYHAECPLKESYNTACLALSAAARRQGITVILTGQGSDELFAGYAGYRLDRFFANRRQPPSPELTPEERLRMQLWGDRTLVYDGNYSELQALKRRLYAPDLAAALPAFDCFNALPINHERLRDRHIVNKRGYLDFKLRLVDHLLADHGDRMAMANGVEVRHPFLDIDLVRFAADMPVDLKLNGFEEKYIVKRLAARYVPREIVSREKFGWFAAGSPDLLRSGFDWVHDSLSADRIERQGYFNSGTIEQLKAAYTADGFRLNQPFDTDLLMLVLTFGTLVDSLKLPTLH
jgi:asparagine synthase (glutamine-hydrolysing)